jgi:flavodoxin
MRYEIAYVSQSGNTERMAYGIADNLSDNSTVITDLANEKITGQADIYMLGFGVNKGTIPLSLMDALDELHGKKIIFFVTSGVEPTEEYKHSVEKKLMPFLPDDCEYYGLFMCYGKWNENVLQKAQNILSSDPENQTAKRVLAEAKNATAHPNDSDFAEVVRFIKKQLTD